MPYSMPNMMATPPVFRQPLGLQHPPGLSGLGHSQSVAHLSTNRLSQSLLAQREEQFLQHDSPVPTVLSAQLQSRSPSPFVLSSREGMTHFGEQATLPHFGGDEIGHDMGLMDNDMLDMLLKPE